MKHPAVVIAILGSGVLLVPPPTASGGMATNSIARVASGDLDPTFSGNGKLITTFPGSTTAWAVAIQDDGKIVAAGSAGSSNTKVAVTRYEPNGTLDSTFGGDGKVTTDLTPDLDDAGGVAIQSDGKIVVAGDAGLFGPDPKFGVLRYNPNGTLDESFGGDGKVTTDLTPEGDFANTLTLQPDGKIVAGGVAGSPQKFALARYNPDGSLDRSFGGDGKVTTNIAPGPDDVQGVEIQRNSRIVATGWGASGGRFALARYLPDGTLDDTFGGGGKVTTDFTPREDESFDSTIQRNGKVVVCGVAGGFGDEGEVALARYKTNGKLDATFGGDGRVTTDFTPQGDFAHAIDIQADGKIVVAGGAAFDGGFALARYLP